MSAEVEAETADIMLDTLGDRYEMMDLAGPLLCKFTTGEVTAQPHSINQTTVIENGDNVISVVKAYVGGYLTELERTMVVGTPTEEQRHYHEIMVESQQVAFDAMAHGVPYGDIEHVVKEYYEEQGVVEYTKLHVGHGIGMEFHERPFLDVDSEGELTAGEVITVEPGFYVPGVGGFRHSDTVVVIEDGIEALTYYPRELDDLLVREC